MTRYRARTGVTPWAGGLAMVAGLYAIVLGWRGAATAASLALQLPFVVSGAFGGLALMVFGAALLHVDTSRRLAAEEVAALRDIVDSSAHAAIAMRDEPTEV
jgi:hypothetical protein